MKISSYGLIPEPLPVRDYSFEVCCGSAEDIELPEEYELPLNLMPSVKDQGSTLMCVAYSMCQCAESKTRSNGEGTEYSPPYNYGREESRNGYEGGGLFASTAIKGALTLGFVPLVYFDIKEDVPEILELAAQRNDLLKIGEKMKPASFVSMAYALEDKKWDSIRTAIYKYQCPVMIISHDYFNGGSHAVIAYGWALTKGKTKGRYLKFQNSWGENWSIDGKSEIPISYIDGAYMLLWDEIKLPFEDVKDTDWFYKDVKAAYLAEFIQGVTATTFEPDKPIIRGDIAVMLARYLDKVEHSVNTFAKTKRQLGEDMADISFDACLESKLEDVEKSDYYYSAINKVCGNGIMQGTAEGEFSPKNSFTRAEAAAVVVRLIEKQAEILGVNIPKANSAPHFSDVNQNAWYYDYVKKACIYGLMQGKGDGIFDPESEITRAESTAIFNRTFKKGEELFKQLI